MDKYDELFEEWKKTRPEYKLFCNDGILNQDEWDKQYSKIMFLLKESYGDFSEIRGHEFGGSGSSGTFWRRMRMWTYIIDEVLDWRTPTLEQVLEVKEEDNYSIAYVNLKKFVEKSGNDSDVYSDDADILNYVERDKDFLLKQIELINPRIILCSGTFGFCNKLFGKIEKISDNLYKTDNIFLIDYYHLSYTQKTYEENYTALMTIAEKLRGEFESVYE
jgi:hypothetical protein